MHPPVVDLESYELWARVHLRWSRLTLLRGRCRFGGLPVGMLAMTQGYPPRLYNDDRDPEHERLPK